MGLSRSRGLVLDVEDKSRLKKPNRDRSQAEAIARAVVSLTSEIPPLQPLAHMLDQLLGDVRLKRGGEDRRQQLSLRSEEANAGVARLTERIQDGSTNRDRERKTSGRVGEVDFLD